MRERRGWHTVRVTAIVVPSAVPEAGRRTGDSRWVVLRKVWREQRQEAAQARVRTRFIVAGIMALSAVSLVGNILTPALIRKPELLMLLTPHPPTLVLAADRLTYVAFLALATLRLFVGDPLHYILGRRFGTRFVSERAKRRLGRFGLAGCALWPRAETMVVAGALEMPVRRVMAANLLGTVLYLALLTGAAHVLFG